MSPTNAPLGQKLQASAQALIDAIKADRKIAALPTSPASLDEAYGVQNAVVAGLGGVAGWKVSPLRPGDAPRCCPLPQRVFHSHKNTFDAAFLASCLAEVEIGVRLGADLPDGEVTVSDVANAIATVHPIVELVVSRFQAGLEAPDLDRAADLQNCGGVVLGEGIADWRGLEFADLVAELTVGGQVGRATVTHPTTDQTLAALAWLGTHAARDRGQPMKAGTFIITGARFGPAPMGDVKNITARVGTLGAVHLLTPAAG